MPPRSKPKPKPPPDPFVLEALAPLTPEVRRMFSGFAVYSGNRLLLIPVNRQDTCILNLPLPFAVVRSFVVIQ